MPHPMNRLLKGLMQMSEQQQFRMRIVFAKQGRLALLSHLEVARALERAVRRARLPFAISNGFSPHMKIAFGAALPVGVGGTRELVDLTLTEYVPPEDALDALVRASVPDLMVLECAYVEPKAPAASAAFPISTYQAVLSAPAPTLPVPADVRVIRKKKERVLAVGEFLVGKPRLKGRVLTFSLEQKPTGSLRPDKLLAACLALVNGDAQGDAGDAEAVQGASDDGGKFEMTIENAEIQPAARMEAVEPLRVLSITRIDQRSKG